MYITHDQAEAFALADRIGVLQAGRLVQCGLPETIYHAPATPFVARFTGVAGQLHGQVAGQPDAAGRFRVYTQSGPLIASVPAATSGGEAACGVEVASRSLAGSGPAPPGSAVTVLVRPAAAHLVTAAAGEGRASSPGDSLPASDGEGLPGRVLDVAYRGHGYDHLVALSDGTQLAGMFAGQRRQVGDEVRVRVDPAGCFAYPADGAG